MRPIVITDIRDPRLLGAVARARTGTGPAVTLVGMRFTPLPPMPLEHWAERNPRVRWPLVLLLLLLLIGLAGGVADCRGAGSGNSADDSRPEIDPPGCINHPEKCA